MRTSKTYRKAPSTKTKQNANAIRLLLCHLDTRNSHLSMVYSLANTQWTRAYIDLWLFTSLRLRVRPIGAPFPSASVTGTVDIVVNYQIPGYN